MSKRIENDKFIINYSSNLEDIVKDMINVTNEKYNDIINFFDIKEFRKITVNLFDDINEFKCFIANIRNVDISSLPSYVQGTFDKGMINAYVKSDLSKDEPLYKIKIHMILHEMVHIIYLEKILKSNYSNRVVWLDEGLALNLSGEYDNNQDLINKVIDKIYNFNFIPNLNDLKHGSLFVNDDYDGYCLSYLSVRYLIDVKSKEELLEIINSKDLSLKEGKIILEEAINYYRNLRDKNKVNQYKRR